VRDTGAHHVGAMVVVISVAATISEVAGQWIKRASLQRLAQNV